MSRRIGASPASAQSISRHNGAIYPFSPVPLKLVGLGGSSALKGTQPRDHSGRLPGPPSADCPPSRANRPSVPSVLPPPLLLSEGLPLYDPTYCLVTRCLIGDHGITSILYVKHMSKVSHQGLNWESGQARDNPMQRKLTFSYSQSSRIRSLKWERLRQSCT